MCWLSKSVSDPIEPDSVDSDTPAITPQSSNDISQSVNSSIPLLDSKKSLMGYLERVLPQAKPRVRAKARDFLWGVSRGEKCKDLLATINWSWPQWSILCNSRPELRGMFRDMQDMGEDWRKIVRHDEVHRRASEGVEEGVYYKGVRVDTIRKYSDKLLELAVKADDPDKYADRSKSENTSKQVSVVFNFEVDRASGEALLAEKRRKEAEQGD